MAKAFGSFAKSQCGVFVKSPAGVRGTITNDLFVLYKNVLTTDWYVMRVNRERGVVWNTFVRNTTGTEGYPVLAVSSAGIFVGFSSIPANNNLFKLNFNGGVVASRTVYGRATTTLVETTRCFLHGIAANANLLFMLPMTDAGGGGGAVVQSIRASDLSDVAIQSVSGPTMVYLQGSSIPRMLVATPGGGCVWHDGGGPGVTYYRAADLSAESTISYLSGLSIAGLAPILRASQSSFFWTTNSGAERVYSTDYFLAGQPYFVSVTGTVNVIWGGVVRDPAGACYVIMRNITPNTNYRLEVRSQGIAREMTVLETYTADQLFPDLPVSAPLTFLLRLPTGELLIGAFNASNGDLHLGWFSSGFTQRKQQIVRRSDYPLATANGTHNDIYWSLACKGNGYDWYPYMRGG